MSRHPDFPTVPPVDPVPLTVAPTEKPSRLEWIRGAWDTLEIFAEQAIEAAEIIYGPGRGEDKARYVADKLADGLHELEGRYDLLPAWLEGMVFRIMRAGLGMLTQRVFLRLKREGRV